MNTRGEKGKQHKNKAITPDPIVSPNKYEALREKDAHSPCRVCQEMVYSDGITCDKCECWVHSASECSELSPADFSFMQRCKSPSIKFVCAACRSEFSDTMFIPNDVAAKNSAKLDLFGSAIADLHDQNKQIMEIIKNNKNTDDSIKAHITEVIGDERDKDDRKQNVIMYNIPECDPKASNTVSEVEDTQKVKNVMSFVTPNIDNSFLNGKTVIRMGKVRAPSDTYPNPKPRPIKVILPSPTEALALRKNARKLKDNQGLNHVGIAADKSWKERLAERELRSEFTRRKNNGEDVVIYNNEIKLRSELPHSTKAKVPAAEAQAADK